MSLLVYKYNEVPKLLEEIEDSLTATIKDARSIEKRLTGKASESALGELSFSLFPPERKKETVDKVKNLLKIITELNKSLKDRKQKELFAKDIKTLKLLVNNKTLQVEPEKVEPETCIDRVSKQLNTTKATLYASLSVTCMIITFGLGYLARARGS